MNALLSSLMDQLARWPNPWQGRAQARLESARRLCLDLIEDVRFDNRRKLAHQIGTARSCEEIRHLRSALFSCIALAHGQHEAQQRVAELDRFLG